MAVYSSGSEGSAAVPGARRGRPWAPRESAGRDAPGCSRRYGAVLADW